MALQDRKSLTAAAVGITDGSQPIAEAPPLELGIHLRWGPGQTRILPYGGYYILRRESPPNRLEGRLFDLFGPRRTSEGFERETDQTANPVTGEMTDRTRVTFSPETFLTAVELLLVPGTGTGLTVVAYTDDRPVDIDSQAAGTIPSGARLRVAADHITSLEVYGDTTLVQIAVVQMLLEEFTSGWNFLHADAAPVTLPLTHPSYPASQGPESIDAARMEAAGRVSYGDPGRLTTDGTRSRPGTVAVEQGSPIVWGTDTDWRRRDAGSIFRVEGDNTSYTVLEVFSDEDGGEERLLLARAYGGQTAQGRSYRLGEDPFGDLHDALAACLDGGPAEGWLHSRRRPAVVFDEGLVTRTRRKRTVVGRTLSGSAPGWTADLEGLTLQVARPTAGTVGPRPFEIRVEGNGTDWDDSLEGLTFRLAGKRGAYTIARVIDATTLELDRPYLGLGGGGQRQYEVFERAAARIAAVHQPEPDPDANSPGAMRQRLKLERSHTGEGHDDGRAYVITGSFTAVADDQRAGREAGVRFPGQQLLDHALLGAVDPAMAQLLGLYWVDGTAQPGVDYDYMVVADHLGLVPYFVQQFNSATGFDFAGFVSFLGQLSVQGALDSYILPGQQLVDNPAPAVPTDVRSYLLPETVGTPEGDDPTARFGVGLRWDRLTLAPNGPLSPTEPVLFTLWRHSYRDLPADSEPAAGVYDLVGRGSAPATDVTVARQVLVGEGVGGEAPFPGWPTAGVFTTDRGLTPGWYSYRVSGTDLFGRHTPRSEPGAWFDPDTDGRHQINPPTNPAHLVDVPAYAIELRGRLPPPPPANVRAEMLNPADPNLSRGVYEDWLAQTGRSAADEPIGLRVRWHWTERAAEFAPDVTGFEVHYLPGRPDTVLGSVTAVQGSGDTRLVFTDIANTTDPTDPATDPLAPDSYVGGSLRVGRETFSVLESETATSPVTGGDVLVLTVRLPPDGDEPDSEVTFTLNVPGAYSVGQVTVTHGSTTVTGQDTGWMAALEGERLDLGLGDGGPPHVVQSVTDGERLELDRPVQLPIEVRREVLTESLGELAEATLEDLLESDYPISHTSTYSITHPLATDLLDPERWPTSLTSVTVGEWTEAPAPAPNTADARPYWTYETVVPAPGLDPAGDSSLRPTLSEPVAHGSIGVNAFTERVEGGVGGPAPIYRVFRDDPDPPAVPDLPAVIDYATRPDYDGQSHYTVRWLPPGRDRYTHVYRALDESLFRADWERREAEGDQRYVLTVADEDCFPATLRGSGSAETQRREAIVASLEDAFHGGNPTGELLEWSAALSKYRQLEPDALQVLASLPENEGAFTRITESPLAAADHPNMIGPDFEVGDPGPAFEPGADDPPGAPSGGDLRAFVDTFDGRSTNRYFYRCGTVDAAGNSSSRLSPSTPPVQSRDGVAPVAPSLDTYECSDGQVTLSWRANRETDLRWYRVYRTDDSGRANDVRRMDRLAELEVGVDVPSAAEHPTVEFVDESVDGGVTYRYRVIAVNRAENPSPSSAPLLVTAVDSSPPVAPVWLDAEWVVSRNGTETAWEPGEPVPDSGSLAIRLAWLTEGTGERYRVSRRPRGAVGWQSLDKESRPRGDGRFEYVDPTADPEITYTYRLRAESAAGVPAEEFPEFDVGRAMEVNR